MIGDKLFGNCMAMRYFQVDDEADVSYTIVDHTFDGYSTELIFIGIHNGTPGTVCRTPRVCLLGERGDLRKRQIQIRVVFHMPTVTQEKRLSASLV